MAEMVGGWWVGGWVGVRELGQVVRDDATTPTVRMSNSSAFTQVQPESAGTMGTGEETRKEAEMKSRA